MTIDELFGYHNDRDKKIEAIIQRIEAYDIGRDGDDRWVDECIPILREGLAEFPQNERLLITLAETLWEAGWRRNHEWLYYDDEGLIQYDYDHHKKNEYWTETVKICENLVSNASDSTIVTKAIKLLVPLYRNYGEYEKAIAYANRMPDLQSCREYLLTEATDGKEEAKYIGEFLLCAAKEFSEQLVFSLISDIRNFDSDMPVEKVKGAIAIFDLICDDGNFGEYHEYVRCLYLYLSRLQWERGYHDDAFVSLEEALKNAKAFDALCDVKEHTLTAPLVSYVKYRVNAAKSITKELPVDWPFWCNPDYTQVEKEIKADPRWEEWCRRTQE